MVPATDDPDEDTVCCNCVGVKTLSEEIEAEGYVTTCSYCDGEDDPCVTLASLALRVADVYEEFVDNGELEPEFDDDSDNVHWRPSGDYPQALIFDLIDAVHYRIAEDIVSHMANVRLTAVLKDDYGDWYDNTNEGYVLEIPESAQFNLAWSAFCTSVKHSRRFFSKDAVEGLDKILGPVLAGDAREGVIITIGPDGPAGMKFIYRGRSAHSEADQKTIYEAPAVELAAPPVEKATAGRMNPAGISVFYGSLDQETCVAELRAPVGGQAIVGKFEVIRPLRILDLTALSSIKNDLDYFHPNFMERQAYARFIQGFHEEIKRSVIPGRETLEYLPTQVVAEYLWTREANAVDGVIFGSAQLTDGRNNIVLFPPALTVEGAEGVVRRKVSRIQRDEGDEYEPEPSDTVWLEPVTEAGPEAGKGGEDFPYIDEFWEDMYAPDPPPATLRFDEKSVVCLRVKGIKYDTRDYSVTLRDKIENPDF